MSDNVKRLVILTGGPGSGKTTLIDALSSRGFRTSREVGRAIIQEQQRIGGRGLPWTDPSLFAELMLSREMAQYAEMADTGDTVFFDRGVPDVAGYLDLVGGSVPDHVAEACRLLRFHDEVFILPPWPEIFGQDTERKQDLAEAVRTFEAMVRTYRGFGYRLVDVPKDAATKRLAFILDRLGLA